MISHDKDDSAKKFMSDVIFHMKYARYLPDLNRREAYVETVDRNAQMHMDKFPKLTDEIVSAFSFVHGKKILPSMRSFQFAGRAIEDKNLRMFNCAFRAIDSVRVFSDIFYALLCGTGVGFSVEKYHISNIPTPKGFNTESVLNFLVEDTIQGWCDALGYIVRAFVYGLPKPIFHYNLIRPKGALLQTSGGRAPGYKPLKDCLDNIFLLLQRHKPGTPFQSDELCDIACYAADATHAGGIRRAAMIAIFDWDDTAMLTYKSMENFKGNSQRSRVNISAVFDRKQRTKDDFNSFWEYTTNNKTGEPAVYWVNEVHTSGPNPCVEKNLLATGQCCNLVTVNVADVRTNRELYNRVIAASRIATLQASYTDFKYLEESWKKNTEADALIGVSLTGVSETDIEKLDLKGAAYLVKKENERIAKLIGINVASRCTVGKPEGTGSRVLGVSCGVHRYEFPYFIKNTRVGKSEPIYQYLLSKVPELVEDKIGAEEEEAIIKLPIKSPTGAKTEESETGIDLLERVKYLFQNWIVPGYRKGSEHNNISCTATLRDDEWEGVGEWLWDNREYYNGIAVFPYFCADEFIKKYPDQAFFFKQIPHEKCTQQKYEELVSYIKDVDLTEIIEYEDNTKLAETVACAGGMCGI